MEKNTQLVCIEKNPTKYYNLMTFNVKRMPVQRKPALIKIFSRNAWQNLGKKCKVKTI